MIPPAESTGSAITAQSEPTDCWSTSSIPASRQEQAVAGVRHREVDRGDPAEEAVEASREPGDLEPAGVHLRELERDLVRLRAGVEQDDLVERRREEGRQPLGEREDGLGEHPRIEVDNAV